MSERELIDLEQSLAALKLAAPNLERDRLIFSCQGGEPRGLERSTARRTTASSAFVCARLKGNQKRS